MQVNGHIILFFNLHRRVCWPVRDQRQRSWERFSAAWWFTSGKSGAFMAELGGGTGKYSVNSLIWGRVCCFNLISKSTVLTCCFRCICRRELLVLNRHVWRSTLRKQLRAPWAAAFYFLLLIPRWVPVSEWWAIKHCLFFPINHVKLNLADIVDLLGPLEAQIWYLLTCWETHNRLR